MSSTKILIIAAVAILFGFAMGRCDLCFNHSHDRHHDKYADEHHPDETQITSNSQGAIQEIQKQIGRAHV